MYAYPELLETQETFSGDLYQDIQDTPFDISLSDIPKYQETDFVEVVPPVRLPAEPLEVEDTTDGTHVTFKDGAIKEAIKEALPNNEAKTKNLLLLAGAGLVLYLLLKK